MSVLISGVLINGAGLPMSGCHIILKSRVNTSAVVIRTVADVLTGNNGEYAIDVQTGKYDVYLRSCIEREYYVGDISVYDDSTPGTLNDFLTALDEGDLKPDVVKRFEELVAQAQQSAKSSAESAQEAGKHAADAEQVKKDVETLAEEVQQNAQQTAQDREETALNAQASEKSAQDARGYRDSAQQIVEGLNASHATTTQKGLVQLSSATDSDSEERAATSKAVKTVMDEVQTRAPLDSPALTGGPTAPTPDLNAKGREIANAAFVRALIAALVGSVPETLDTLNELAAALDNDPHFATTMTNALAGKQPLSEILTSLSGLMTAGNKLAYFSDKNVMALANLTAVGRVLIGQDSRAGVLDYLGLKSAAMMEPQSDIYDRTEGRLAIPGAFGFGHIFSTGEAVSFNSENDFLDWVRRVTPGEYLVDGGNKIIPGNVLFRGIVRIRWVESRYSAPNPLYTAKAIMFYGINGHIYYNRYWTTGDGWLTGWENLKVNEASLRALIETRAPLNSPVFTGTPKAPTPPDDATGTEIVNATFVRKLLAGLVGSSPEALDTLNELAAALGNDPNFATTVTNALAGKQPLNAVLTALSNLTQRADTLPYFNADEDVSLAPLSEKARSLLAQETPEDMRTVLELKSAATMEPQSDIYDFTGNRLAIPGAYGYGGFPGRCEYFSADKGRGEFEEWVKATPPGRYFVTQSGSTGMNKIIPDGIYFRGMVEIQPARSGWSIDNHTESEKLVIFYGDEGDIYTNCFNPRFNPGQRLRGWVNAIFRDIDVGYVLKSCGGTYIGYNYPAPGGLVLAAYCGGSEKKIYRNLSVSGSQLALVSVMTSTGQGASALQASVDLRSMSSGSMPGLYYSLSGSPFITCDESMAMIGLFVRIA